MLFRNDFTNTNDILLFYSVFIICCPMYRLFKTHPSRKNTLNSPLHGFRRRKNVKFQFPYGGILKGFRRDSQGFQGIPEGFSESLISPSQKRKCFISPLNTEGFRRDSEGFQGIPGLFRLPLEAPGKRLLRPKSNPWCNYLGEGGGFEHY